MARRMGWILLYCLGFAVMTIGCDCGPSIAQCNKDSDCQGSRVCTSKTGRCACVEDRCKPVACLNNTQCPVGIKCVNYECGGKPTRCTSDADCAKGQKCNTTTGLCINSGECASDGECDGGKSCCNLDNGKGSQCNFKRCLKHEDCQAGSKNTCVEPITCKGGIKPSCIKGACACAEPCGGGDCGAGKCCDVGKDSCVDNPKPCADLQCPPGTRAPDSSKFSVDPKSCNITGPDCKCEKLPPLPMGDVGTHSEIGIFNNQPVLSAYNETYGDLMVGFKQGDGTIKWEFVDGIPSGGKVEGDSAGPRGGIKEEGDDVGKYTSIAVGNGAIHVSYYDATNGALKYARKSGDKWEVHTVDKDGKQVGRYTSITLDNGAPVIAYFVANNNQGKSQLRVARASSATPAQESDWTVKFADTLDLPACKGACDEKKKEVCVKEGNAFSCKVPTGDADKCQPKACDKDKEACVAGKCLELVDDSANPPLPHGTGLFPSIATLPGGGVIVAYYVKDTGDLKITTQGSNGNFVGQPLKTAGDVGQFPSVAVDASGNIHISYLNVDTADIHYLQLDSSRKIKVDEIVDDGVAAGEDRLLADTSIAVDPGGTPRIVYQDASVQALKLASRRGAKQWEVKALASGEDTPYTGAFGFFADQFIQGNTSFISNYRFNLRDKNASSGIDLRQWP